METKDKVYRLHVVTDQGNGGAYCSKCSYDLTDQMDYQSGHISWHTAPNPCPGCGVEWIDTPVTGYGFGGSDF